MEETRVSGENHRPAASDWQTLSHNVVLSTPEQDSNSQLPCDHDHDGPYEYNVEILYYRNKTLFLHCGIQPIWKDHLFGCGGYITFTIHIKILYLINKKDK
jgi:hypothetical protein